MPAQKISLPQDEGIQKDPIEWWYWSGHAKGMDGNTYSFMLALFKVRPLPYRKVPAVWFVHSLVSCIDTGEFEPHIEFFLKGLDRGSFSGKQFKASVKERLKVGKKGEGNYHIQTPRMEFDLHALKPVMLVGGTGNVDLKSSTTTYYSWPRMSAKGRLRLKGSAPWVDAEGMVWMDHQWSPISLHGEHVWRWFCFQLDDGTDAMCFEYGRKKRAAMVTLSDGHGGTTFSHKVDIIPLGESWISPTTGAAYPLEWKITAPELDFEVTCRARVKEQEMLFGLMNYWEGPLAAEAMLNGKKTEGSGFMELVGFPRRRSLPAVAMEGLKRLFK